MSEVTTASRVIASARPDATAALMSGADHGRPVPAHMDLPVAWEHFERWLGLFRETARETFQPAGADHVIERALRITRSLQFAVADAARTAAGPPPVLR